LANVALWIKRARAVFEDLLYQLCVNQVPIFATDSITSAATGTGVKPVATEVYLPGRASTKDNQRDVA